MNEKEKALYYFRNLVYCIYREIRVFVPSIFDELYKMIKIDSGYFNLVDGKRIAGDLYDLSKLEEKTSAIVSHYRKKTGLSLIDLKKIFGEGNWKIRSAFGGYSWAMITQKTIDLKKVIDSEDWQGLSALLKEIDEIRHNNGRVIEKFREYPSWSQ